MDGLIEGRIVHYVLTDTYQSMQRHVPAIVVRVWENGIVNLQVFLDGSNDDPKGVSHPNWKPWHTSVKYDEKFGVGTWHWIEKA